MRAAGVPARVVVGYQGAEYNPYEDYMMVYQYNAHAWAEVWFEGAGWVRVDPTAAVSPQRITLGVEAVLANEPGFLGESVFSMMRFRNTKWLNSLRLRLDAIDYAWNRWVISYDDEVQFQFLRDVFGANAERKILFTLIALFALCLAILTFVMFRNRAQGRKSVVDTLYLGFCKDLARLGSVRNIGEGPLSYCERVCVEKPELSQSIQNITAMYVKLAYGGALANEMRTKVKINAFRKMLRLFRLRVTPTAWNLARKSW